MNAQKQEVSQSFRCLTRPFSLRPHTRCSADGPGCGCWVLPHPEVIQQEVQSLCVEAGWAPVECCCWLAPGLNPPPPPPSCPDL